MPYNQFEDDFKVGWHKVEYFPGGSAISESTVGIFYAAGQEPKCCCTAAKCHMPDTLAVTMSGFWSEWIIPTGNPRYHTHAGCPNANCPPNVPASDCHQQAIECFQASLDAQALTWFPTRDRFSPNHNPGQSYLCIQNPELLSYFPSISCGSGPGCDPPAPINVDALYAGWNFVTGADLFAAGEGTGLGWRVPKLDGWTVSLPSCPYWFGDQGDIYFVSATAGDLDQQTVVLRRAAAEMPPVLVPHITRQRAAQPGETFNDAQLLFDVYLRPFQQDWVPRDQNGNPTPEWDGRLDRYSVDYVCNPRYYPPTLIDGVYQPYIFNYKCLAPAGIVPPKLRAAAHSGGGSAELEFTIEPVFGSGFTPRDTLWRVASVSVKDGGSGASVGDVYRIDFYESPMRGGEYRNSETPQEVVVTSVDQNGSVTAVALIDPVDGRPQYGRFLCHPNGVAFRGSGYSQGDMIEWRAVNQPPVLGGGFVREYQRARAVVTEVDENGGILDWWMPNATNGDGDNSHTEQYDCIPQISGTPGECLNGRSEPHQDGAPCAEDHDFQCASSLAAVDCRGLYSDVMHVDRCYLRYEGYAGFRASAAVASDLTSVCTSVFCGGSTYSPKCSIQAIPIYFEIIPVETRLRIDITAPASIPKTESVASVVVNIAASDGSSQTLDLPPAPSPVQFGDDFIQHAESEISAPASPSHKEINSVGVYAGRLGVAWPAVATVSVTHGLVSRSPVDVDPTKPRAKSITIFGTVGEVDGELSQLYYFAPHGAHGQDRLVIHLEATPPGFSAPVVAKAAAIELLDRCEEIPGCDPNSGILHDHGMCVQGCGDEAVLAYKLMLEQDQSMPFEYPESRPLGGLKTYEVTDPGSGYALWDHSSKSWVEQTNLEVIIGSAWDDFREYLMSELATETFDAFAEASATVDLNVNSATFGQVTEVVSVKPGYWYVIHEHDKMWRANLSWNFSFQFAGGPMAGFPGLTHRDGYTFGETYPCSNPENSPLSYLGDDLMSQCADRTKRCKPYPNDNLWSFEYCPHNLIKTYTMMMLARPNQVLNRPTLLGAEADATCRQDNCLGSPPSPCCRYGMGWCEHPQQAVTHDVVCYHIYPNGSFSIGEVPSPYSMILNFGNGPIEFAIEFVDPQIGRGDDRERSVY